MSDQMANELLHFSAKPLRRVKAVAQEREAGGGKPDGLWVSVGLSWAEWCQSESFALDRFACVTRVVLADDAKILRVSGADELDAFNREYQGPARGYPFDWSRGIDWRRIAETYDGIIIAPYIWERRLMMDRTSERYNWYYSWDVASGCIWHPRAIASLECVELDALTLAKANDENLQNAET